MNEKADKVYQTLSAIDCRAVSKKKNGLTYLPWAWAWAKVKENFPLATYKVYETADGLIYHHDGKTAWVKTSVTIEGVENVEILPVMDFKNQAIPLNAMTSTAVNKAIQRALTKACARHGLGLYIYQGEDLPDGAEDATPSAPKAAVAVTKAAVKTVSVPSALRGLAAEAWGLYKSLPLCQKQTAVERERGWGSAIKTTFGKDSAADLTEMDWKQFITRLTDLVEQAKKEADASF